MKKGRRTEVVPHLLSWLSDSRCRCVCMQKEKVQMASLTWRQLLLPPAPRRANRFPSCDVSPDRHLTPLLLLVTSLVPVFVLGSRFRMLFIRRRGVFLSDSPRVSPMVWFLLLGFVCLLSSLPTCCWLRARSLLIWSWFLLWGAENTEAKKQKTKSGCQISAEASCLEFTKFSLIICFCFFLRKYFFHWV